MKLLLDENLSRRLVPFLQQYFPETTQVTLLNLETASDIDIWQYAREHDFVIVTKDADFYELSLQHQSHVPKVIWLRIANSSKDKVLELLIKNKTFIEQQLGANGKLCVQIY